MRGKRQIQKEDAVLVRAEQVLAEGDDAADFRGRYAALTVEYRSLLRKLNKTLVISDTYQSQLVDLNNTLHQKIEEETAKRLAHEKMLAQQAKLAAMGEMIGAIAHQWRQPLSTVAVIVQNIRDMRRMGMLEDAYVESATADALAQIMAMSETIETFRSFFKPGRSREAFSAWASVEAAASLVREQLARDRIRFVLSQRPDGARLHGFQNELTQVLLNLINNSHDAIMERRSAGILQPEDVITLEVGVADDGITIRLHDNGCGISPQVAANLFQPYFTTKRDGKGTGIGLYLSRLIIEESMQGTIGFTSTDAGTVFTIVLPRV